MPITVDHYIQFQKISKEMPELDKNIIKLSILFNKPAAHFEAMPFARLETHIRFLSAAEAFMPAKPKRVIWINGTRYKARTEAKLYSTETWLSLVHYRKIGVEANLHNILSWIYRPTFINDAEWFHPLKWMLPKLNPEKYAKDFLKSKISDVSGTFFLFAKNWNKWNLLLGYSIMNSERILTQHLKDLEAHLSLSTGDGITPLTGSLAQRQA